MFISCDYAGPYYVYEEVTKKEKKVWILLICCLVTRHIHTEMVADCKTDTFLEAFRSFMALRGHPKKVFSDQASYFKSASKQLKEILRKVDWIAIKHRLLQNYHFDWEFFTPLASSKAGIVEVCIKLFKEALEKA